MADAKWLLDTSVLVDLLRGRQEAREWIDSLDSNARWLSVVTVAELLAGSTNKREERIINRELELYQIEWIDEPTSQRALELYREFRLSHGVGFLDCMIAASAMEKRLLLATLNLKHFAPFVGL
jgi:predicted nucleic acid-binding protein